MKKSTIGWLMMAGLFLAFFTFLGYQISKIITWPEFLMALGILAYIVIMSIFLTGA